VKDNHQLPTPSRVGTIRPVLSAGDQDISFVTYTTASTLLMSSAVGVDVSSSGLE
jgi:hypothetical protein